MDRPWCGCWPRKFVLLPSMLSINGCRSCTSNYNKTSRFCWNIHCGQRRPIINWAMSSSSGWPMGDVWTERKNENTDQDDFIIIRSADGTKRRMDGAAVYQPVYGEEIVSQSQSIQVPINHYMIVFDQNSTMPEKHIRGPCKFYPEPFQQSGEIIRPKKLFPMHWGNNKPSNSPSESQWWCVPAW